MSIEHKLTSHQRAAVEHLAETWGSVAVTPAPPMGVLSVNVDCWADAPHPDEPTPEPDVTFRVYPSGLRLDLAPLVKL